MRLGPVPCARVNSVWMAPAEVPSCAHAACRSAMSAPTARSSMWSRTACVRSSDVTCHDMSNPVWCDCEPSLWHLNSDIEIGDPRPALEIASRLPKLTNTECQRLAESRLSNGNFVQISQHHTCPIETGLAGWGRSPIRTSLANQIPCSRRKNRDFLSNRPSNYELPPECHGRFSHLRPKSLVTGTGNPLDRAGNFWKASKELWEWVDGQNGIPIRCPNVCSWGHLGRDMLTV